LIVVRHLRELVRLFGKRPRGSRLRSDGRAQTPDRSDHHAVLLAPPSSLALPERMPPTVPGALGPVRVDVLVVERLLRVRNHLFQVVRRIVDELPQSLCVGPHDCLVTCSKGGFYVSENDPHSSLLVRIRDSHSPQYLTDRHAATLRRSTSITPAARPSAARDDALHTGRTAVAVRR
jgi:hypothetical protein